MTTDQKKEAKRLRAEGMSYRAIGKKFGVSYERIRMIVNPSERQLMAFRHKSHTSRSKPKIPCYYCQGLKKVEL